MVPSGVDPLEPTVWSSNSVYFGHLVVPHGARSRDTGTRRQSRTSSFSILLSGDLLRDEHRTAAPCPTPPVYPVHQLRPHSVPATLVGGVVSPKVRQQTPSTFFFFFPVHQKHRDMESTIINLLLMLLFLSSDAKLVELLLNIPAG